MSDGLTDEEVMLVDTVRAFVDRDVKPGVREAFTSVQCHCRGLSQCRGLSPTCSSRQRAIR